MRFFVFFFFYLSYVVPNTDHFISHCPPATDGSISQASEHQIMKTNRVVSLHPQSVMYSEKKLYCSYCTTEICHVNMSLNRVGDVKPEEAAARKQVWGTGSH